MTYKVNFQTGARNKSGFRKIETAKCYAEEYCCYTQQNIIIENEYGKEVAYLPWYGTVPDQDDIVIAQFGNFGFYGEWQDF
jgi:hypothetical protein